MSMTTTLDSAPQASPILASGQLLHHLWMTAGSWEASRTPLRVLGCFPGEEQSRWPQVHRPSTIAWQGNSFQPQLKYSLRYARVSTLPPFQVHSVLLDIAIIKLVCRETYGEHQIHEKVPRVNELFLRTLLVHMTALRPRLPSYLTEDFVDLVQQREDHIADEDRPLLAFELCRVCADPLYL